MQRYATWLFTKSLSFQTQQIPREPGNRRALEMLGDLWSCLAAGPHTDLGKLLCPLPLHISPSRKEHSFPLESTICVLEKNVSLIIALHDKLRLSPELYENQTCLHTWYIAFKSHSQNHVLPIKPITCSSQGILAKGISKVIEHYMDRSFMQNPYVCL